MLEQVEHDGTISLSRAAEVQGQLNFAGGFCTSGALKFLVSSFGRADLVAMARNCHHAPKGKGQEGRAAAGEQQNIHTEANQTTKGEARTCTPEHEATPGRSQR